MNSGSVDGDRIRSDRVNVGVAEYRVTDAEVELTTSGLGSCLAVALYAEPSQVAGLGHFMLPEMPSDDEADDAKYVDTGIDRMLVEMEGRGASARNVVAKIAGGGTLLSSSNGERSIGTQNVAAARQVLADANLRVAGEDVGDDYGRSVRFDATTGEVTVVGAHTDTIYL